MRTIASLIIGIVCALPVYALAADGTDTELPADSRIKLLMYDESDVYTITSKYGFQTNLVFGQDEEIQTISVGDRSPWQIIPSGNRIFIRPLEENVTTNMTVLTSRHSYQFDLKSISLDNKDANIVYVAKFIYPAKHKIVADPFMMPPASGTMPAPTPSVVATQAVVMPASPVAMSSPIAETPAPQPGPPNYRYTYSGPDALAPLQVYDNGVSTFLKFRDIKQPLPNPYVVDASGNERPLSYTVQDGMMVIGRIVGQLELKSGDGTVNIYNEILNPNKG